MLNRQSSSVEREWMDLGSLQQYADVSERTLRAWISRGDDDEMDGFVLGGSTSTPARAIEAIDVGHESGRVTGDPVYYRIEVEGETARLERCTTQPVPAEPRSAASFMRQ